MLIIPVTLEVMRERFAAFGYSDQFTDFGLEAIIDYHDREDDPGAFTQLDVISLCCSFVEYESLADYNEQNDTNIDSLGQIPNIIAWSNVSGRALLYKD